MNKQSPLGARQFEELFDRFVATETGGHRLDERDEVKAIRGAKCADYFFPDSNVIVELKTLNENHGDMKFVVDRAREAAARLGHPVSLVDTWLNGAGSLPNDVKRAVDAKLQNALKNTVRKANEQIRSTRSILKKRYDGILVVANLGEYLFGPIELLRNLAGHAMGRTSLSIDAILLITPGVAYSSFGGHPEHYIAPVYSDGKTYLGDFIEPLAEKWIGFEAASLGLRPVVEKVYELDHNSKVARPIRWP